MQLRYHSNDDDTDHTGPHSARRSARTSRPFEPPVDREAIFRQLIHQELRRHRLNKATRARIVRYACGMGLTATRAGELVRECAEEIAAEGDTPQRGFALRLLREPSAPDRVATPLLLAIGVTAALLASMLWHRFF